MLVAEHLSPQHSHGPGARPKDPISKTAKTAGPLEASEQKATAQAEQGTIVHCKIVMLIGKGYS